MRFAFQSDLARSGKYRPDIDGLRAVAVLSVLFFHANIPGFSGGYVGVDIFFVISGYLITSLILKEDRSEGFTFIGFYERRMRRIFPALFAVLFFSILAAGVLFAPRDLLAFAKTVIATTLFASNIYFARAGKVRGYFDSSFNPQPLLHTWSLSVEEQFYLLFPAFLILTVRKAKGRAKACLFAVTIVSFLLSVWWTDRNPVSAFYIFIPRAWELLVGALLAMKAMPPLRSRALREVAEWLGLGLIAWTVYFFTGSTSFPGLNALLPCLGAWLIIYAGESGPSSLRTCLAFRPLVFVGLISYSLYLWHWPIIAFSRYFAAGELDGRSTALVILCSLAMAFVSFEFVERPFRGGKSAVTRRQIFLVGVVASALTIACGSVILLRQGLPGRYDAQTRQLVLSNTERRSDFQEVCGNWRKKVDKMEDITFCYLGPKDSRKIMFWGDSHVQQLYPLIKQFYDNGIFGSHGALLAISNGCVPAEHMTATEPGSYCDTFSTYAMIRAEETDIDTVYIGFNTWWASHDQYLCASVNGSCVQKLSMEEERRRFYEELADHIRRLKMRGKRVIVSLPFPMYDKSIPHLEVRNAVFSKLGLSGVAKDVTVPIVREQILSAAEGAGADLFDPRASLCDEHGCITEIDGISIYKDDNHIAESQIGLLEENLKEVLQPPPAGGAAPNRPAAAQAVDDRSRNEIPERKGSF